MKELKAMIKAQQKGHNEDDVFMVGEQLKDIAEREPSCIDILKRDLQVTGMGLKGAAAALKAYSDKNHKGRTCFIISPARAETILREFYGLPDKKKADTSAHGSASPSFIDLGSFF